MTYLEKRSVRLITSDWEFILDMLTQLEATANQYITRDEAARVRARIANQLASQGTGE